MKLLLLGVLPRNNAANTNRTENVSRMISILDNGSSVRFLNMRDSFYAGDGVFYTDLYTADLLHLSALGYVTWQSTMDSLFQEMYNSTQFYFWYVCIYFTE